MSQNIFYFFFKCFELVKLLSWTRHNNFSTTCTWPQKRKQLAEICEGPVAGKHGSRLLTIDWQLHQGWPPVAHPSNLFILEADKLCQIWPCACNVLLEHSPTHLFTAASARQSWVVRRPHGSQSLKYLLSAPLQATFAHLCLPTGCRPAHPCLLSIQGKQESERSQSSPEGPRLL